MPIWSPAMTSRYIRPWTESERWRAGTLDRPAYSARETWKPMVVYSITLGIWSCLWQPTRLQRKWNMRSTWVHCCDRMGFNWYFVLLASAQWCMKLPSGSNHHILLERAWPIRWPIREMDGMDTVVPGGFWSSGFPRKRGKTFRAATENTAFRSS